jgi:hypothetical protein
VEYTAQIVSDLEGELRKDWSAFVAKLNLPVFYRLWFVEPYYKSGMQIQLGQGYVVIRSPSQDSILAIVPVYVLDPLDLYGDLTTCSAMGAARGKRAVVTHCCHCYDTTLPLSNASTDIVRAILRAMANFAASWEAELFGIMNIDEEDPLCHVLNGVACERYTMPSRYRMLLTKYGSISEFLQSLRSKVRWELKRQWRRAMEEGCLVAVSSPSHTDLREVVRLCRATAAKYGGEEFYPESAFHNFLLQIAEGVKIVTVHVHNVLVSAWICLHDGDSLHTWAAGARYDLSRFSPYYVGFLRCVQYAIENGYKHFEAGRTNAKFKLRHNLMPLQLYGFLGRVEEWASQRNPTLS